MAHQTPITRSRGNRGTGTNQNDKNDKNESREKTPNRFDLFNNIDPENNHLITQQHDPETEEKGTESGWKCKTCKEIFPKNSEKVMECERCRCHYCTKCLGISSNAQTTNNSMFCMFFCIPCKEQVKKNIVVDRKIEAKCEEMMQAFETRIKNMEAAISQKCDKEETREIVKEELEKRLQPASIAAEGGINQTAVSAVQHSNLNDVVSEINDRKARESNLVIYGIDEVGNKPFPERQDHDAEMAKEVIQSCGVTIDDGEVQRTARLGSYDKKRAQRPMLVVLKNPEKKKNIFIGGKTLRETEKFKKVSLSNDLTHAEREHDKKLYGEAKEQEKQQQNSGEFTFKVRGPPWARKIVKLKVTPEGEATGSAGGH